ncbi:hypothetical protein pdam_00010445 [Pocillopora damicornis]|uniref:Uncharacterized protein n=1 Tax=Pocillopora damicornis TaxID=46731 RepID=A0A3M6UA08_POCDA|nr:hypothetical protein pdam_00010445 [Pocillopora damicornis]
MEVAVNSRIHRIHNKVATYTQEQLTKLQQSVAHINARHSSTVAKSMTANVRSRTRCVLS